MRTKKSTNPEIVAILSQGKDSQFWQTLKKIIQDEKIALLEDVILDGEYTSEPNGEKHLLSEEVVISRRELARIERDNWKELVAFPEMKIRKLTQKSIEFDPDKEE